MLFWTSLILRLVLRYLLSRIFMGFLFLLELYNLNFCHLFYSERTIVFNSYWGTYYARTGVAIACLGVFWTRWYFFINLLPIFFITLERVINRFTWSLELVLISLWVCTDLLRIFLNSIDALTAFNLLNLYVSNTWADQIFLTVLDEHLYLTLENFYIFLSFFAISWNWLRFVFWTYMLVIHVEHQPK